MSLLRSSSFKVVNKSLHETSLPAQSYVLSVASLSNFYTVSASAPSNQIHLFDKAALQSTCVLKGHENAITQLCTVHRLGALNRETLLSSGKDGCVIAWDERSGSAAVKMQSSGKSRPLLCCDASEDGMLVAAGTDLQKEDAFIIYWDPRNPAARLRSHGSTHSDDITAVHFSKGDHTLSSNKVLLSTSSDGLISTSNALEADEDEAVIHVANWGCSLSQGGWINNGRRTRIWAASDMETFSCWTSELDQVLSLDIRNPSMHDYGHTWVTDYLITGHATRRVASGLGVFVGSNEGDLALITSNVSGSMAPWTIHSVWTGGHSGIVRSLYWDEKHDVLVTGGEDSKIITWHIQTSNLTDPLMSDVPMEPESLKREWDDTMNDDKDNTGSKRLRW